MRYGCSLMLDIAVLCMAAPGPADAQQKMPFAASGLAMAGPKPTPFASNDSQIPPADTGADQGAVGQAGGVRQGD
jgi:hypothetical protein